MNTEQENRFRFDSEKSPAPGFIDLTREPLTKKPIGIERAHFLLGQMYRSQIQYQFKERLKRTKKTALEKELDLMRKVRERGLELSQQLKANPDEKHLLLGTAIELYFSCLDRWSEGAGIDPLYALWLQNDNVDCLAVMYRPDESTVVIGHTEEDTAGTYSQYPGFQPEIVVISSPFDPQRKISALMIPYLLPGSAYAYDNYGYFQSINGLYQTENPTGQALANMAAWLTAILGSQVDPRFVIQALLPFTDGYNLNVVYQKEGEDSLSAFNITFVHGVKEIRELGKEIGSVLVANNTLDEKIQPLTAPYQAFIKTEEYQRKKEIMLNAQDRLPRIMASLHKLVSLSSRQPSPEDYGWAMAVLLSLKTPKLPLRNEKVVSTSIASLSPDGFRVWAGAGSASKRGYEFREVYPRR